MVCYRSRASCVQSSSRGGFRALPTQNELEEASNVLANSWKRGLNPEIKPQVAFAQNAALLKMIVGQLDAASQLLDEIEARDLGSDETKLMRVTVYRRQRKIDDAVRVADTLSETPRNLIARADLRLQSYPEQVHHILKDRKKFIDPREIVGAALTVIDAYREQDDFSRALEEAERLDHLLPNEPHASLAIYRIKRDCGDANAGEALDSALARVSTRSCRPASWFVKL